MAHLVLARHLRFAYLVSAVGIMQSVHHVLMNQFGRPVAHLVNQIEVTIKLGILLRHLLDL